MNLDKIKLGEVIDLSGSSRATTGTIRNDFRTGYAVQIKWTVNSQNVANNTSNVTIQVQFVSTGSSYNINSTATKNGTLTLNGTTYSFTFTAGLTGGQTKTVFTKTLDIAHNSDGTKTCSMSCGLGINVTLSGTYWGTVSANGTGTFNTIPRTSSFTLNTTSGTLGSTAFTVTIARASTSFTHKVYYKFGSNNTTVSTNATTSCSFTPPLSLASQIPNATSGTATVTVETYNGSTLIGSSSKTITLSVPSSVVPTISNLTATIVDAGASTTYGYVKGKSKCKLVITGAVGSQGSTISSYSISGGGFSTTNSSFTTGVLNSSGDITFTAYVTDSRGRKSANKTVTINVNDYSIPTILYPTAYRCNAEGTPQDDGTYIKVHFEYTHSSNITGNNATNKIEYKKSTSSTWTNEGALTSSRGIIIGGGAISTSSTYNVRFTVSDVFSTVTKTLDVSPSFVTLDFKRGGKGIAIGKASETDNLLEIAIPTTVTQDLTIKDRYPVTFTKPHLSDWTNSTVMSGKTYYGGWHGDGDSNGYISFGSSGSSTCDLIVDGELYAKENQKVYHTGNKPAWNDISGKPTIVSDGSTLGRLTFSNWIYSTGDTGWCNSTYSGGWYMNDSTWLKSYNNKGILSTGTSRLGTVQSRYIKGNSNGSDSNLDIVVASGKSIYLNPNATAGVSLYVNSNWSGSGGTEPSFYNNKGNGWGFVGNSGQAFFRVYGSGGSVSNRAKKYDITKADCSEQYENIKTINIYNYRTISDKINDETGEIEDKLYRQDLMLGTMVDELPTETVFYDNESGDGKAVDMYSYTSMILGATKHLQEKVETLEKENEDKNKVIADLQNRLDKMEEILNGIINKG